MISINNLSKLKLVTGDLFINQNESLHTITLNPEIKGFQRLWIRDNDVLEQIGPFSTVDSIPEIIFGFNPILTKLPEFENLKYVSGRVSLFACPSLESYEGFDKLEYVSGGIGLIGNGPTDMKGFEAIQFLGDGLKIQSHPNLTSLAGLSSNFFEMIDSTLIVEDNPKLSYCAVEMICDHLGEDRPYIISDNLMGCNTEDEIVEACVASSADEVETLFDAVSLVPNPTTGIFEVEWNLGIAMPRSYEIFTAAGQRVQVGDFEVGERMAFDISEEGSGIYFVRLRLEDGRVLVRRIVKGI